MRIIAGMARGIPLNVPTSDKTRPTSDRVKEAIFSALENHIDIDGTNVIDLFAGTGALGLEAISRGAISCTFVEKNQQMCEVIKTNIDKVEKAVNQFETTAPKFEVIGKEVDTVLRDPSTSLRMTGGSQRTTDGSLRTTGGVPRTTGGVPRTTGGFDIVFCDPPYDREFISLNQIVKPGGIIVYETSKAKFEALKEFLNDLEIIYSKTMSDTGVIIAALARV